MKSTMLNMVKQKTWQKNTLFTGKMLKGCVDAIFIMLFPYMKKIS